MNSELVFSVGQIFDNATFDGALGKHGAEYYLIAPYQRGYKWSAQGDNGAVNRLLKDLRDQFIDRSPEYYLQYITTKVNDNKGVQVLELIDGQQRLTTLTLLFAVLASITGNTDFSFVDDKLSYQVREHVSRFFAEVIYNDIESIPKNNWDDYLKEHPHYNEQDIFYLFNATQRMFAFLQDPEYPVDLESFALFVKNSVKIILNNVTGHISCEKVFSNLNNNKVELTDVELIKGLFLTRAARSGALGRDPGYKEVVEFRTLLGRQWDDIVSWSRSPDICALFFNNGGEPIAMFLELLARKHGYQPSANPGDDKYALFDFFQKEIKKNGLRADAFFQDLKSLRGILNNWFTTPAIYNTLGYLFYAKKSGITIFDLIDVFERPLKDVERQLKRRAFNLIPKELDKLDFETNDHEIHHALLALSVFSSKEKFNFTAFSKEDWSLEHIFPQKPADLPPVLQEKDYSLIKALLTIPIGQKDKLIARFGKFNLNNYNALAKKLKKFPCTLSEEESRLLYTFLKPEKLNAIGNMALLTRSDNSSNKNGMFSKKRHNIVERISKGSFVPRHTFDVFSKLISPQMSDDTSLWTAEDITVHQQWIISKISQLKKDLLTLK